MKIVIFLVAGLGFLPAATAQTVSQLEKALANGSQAAPPKVMATQRDYRSLDEAVKAVYEPTLDRTAKALGALARTDWEKARAIYDWLCNNIAYDVSSYYHPPTLETQTRYATEEAAFERRLSVCAGYARLFQGLAERLGLKAVTISGRAKGTGYQLGHEISVNHDWNAVQLDGQWHLMDATWGAGYVNNEQEGFVRRPTSFWFDVDPRLAIRVHLPEDPRWALLDRVPTYAEYKRDRPPVFSPYQELADLGLTSAQIASLPDEKLAEPAAWTLVRLGQQGVPLETLVNTPMVQLPDENVYETLRTAGFSGKSILDLHGQRAISNDEAYQMTYLVEAGFSLDAVAQSRSSEGYVVVYQTKTPFTVVEAPASGRLTPGVPVHFRIQTSGRAFGAVLINKRWEKLQCFQGGTYDVTVVPQKGELSVLVSTEDQDHGYETLLGYRVSR